MSVADTNESCMKLSSRILFLISKSHCMTVAACNFKLSAVLAPLSLSGFPSLSSVWNPATSVDYNLPAAVFVNGPGLFYHIMMVVYVLFN